MSKDFYSIDEVKDSIKIGDVLLFYHQDWYYFVSKIISLGIHSKKEHGAIITNILKENNKVYFYTSEMVAFNTDFSIFNINFFRGKIIERIIEINDDFLLKKSIRLFYARNIRDIDQDKLLDIICEIKNMRPFYSWYMALISPKNERLPFLEKKLTKSTIQRGLTCTQYINLIFYKYGLLSSEEALDKYKDPQELANLSFLDCREVIRPI